MPSFPGVWSTNAITNANESAANTETVVATLSGLITRYPSQIIILQGWVALTPGTTATSVTTRIRRLGLTGTVAVTGPGNSGDIVASKVSDLSINGSDQPGEVSQFTYVLTAQGAGEGTAFSVQNVWLEAQIV